jgi:ketosteroid isomerase-like protein
MTQENAELVRAVFEAVSRGDIDAALASAADEFVVDWSNSIGPAKGIYRGKERVREFAAAFLGAFDHVRWHPTEIVDVDESRLIVVNQARVRGRCSGVEVDAVGVGPEHEALPVEGRRSRSRRAAGVATSSP